MPSINRIPNRPSQFSSAGTDIGGTARGALHPATVPIKARADTTRNLSVGRGPAFWLWFAVKLVLGLGQMAGAVTTLFLLIRHGFVNEALWSFVITASLTTISMILFKVLGWHPAKE